MLALVAAAIFALALLLDLVEANVGDALTPQTLMFAGLFFLALHLRSRRIVAGERRLAGAWGEFAPAVGARTTSCRISSASTSGHLRRATAWLRSSVVL